MQNKSESNVRIAGRIRRTKFHSAVFPCFSRDSYKLGTILMRPGYVFRRPETSKPGIRIRYRICKCGNIQYFINNPGNKAFSGRRIIIPLFENIKSVLWKRYINMKSAAAFQSKWVFGIKGGKKSVSWCNSLDHRLESHQIICSCKSVTVFKVYFMLPGPLFMMGTFPAEFPFVQATGKSPFLRSPLCQGAPYPNIPPHHGNICGSSFFIGFKQIKFALRTYSARIPHFFPPVPPLF